jgi:hypothetical protein
MTPEAKVLAYAKRKARLMGMVPLRLSMQRGVEVGWPDLIVLKSNVPYGTPGSVLFMEVKAEGGKPSEIQQARLQQLRSLGFEPIVAAGRAEVDAALVKFAMGD